MDLSLFMNLNLSDFGGLFSEICIFSINLQLAFQNTKAHPGFYLALIVVV